MGPQAWRAHPPDERHQELLATERPEATLHSQEAKLRYNILVGGYKSNGLWGPHPPEASCLPASSAPSWLGSPHTHSRPCHSLTGY